MSGIAFLPVRTAADLDTLDEFEMQEGSRDGLNNQPEPGGNRSRSYWHGWRNGMTDAGHRERDEHRLALARDWTRAMRERRS